MSSMIVCDANPPIAFSADLRMIPQLPQKNDALTAIYFHLAFPILSAGFSPSSRTDRLISRASTIQLL